MSVSKSEVFVVVRQSLAVAVPAVSALQFEQKRAAGSLVDRLPRFARLRLGTAESVWAAVLFVDLRGSTERAKAIGARATYIAMHALLPALAFVTGRFGGYVVGFRGDGLFSAFGLSEDGPNPPDLDQGEQVQQAAVCGQTMIEAVRTVVNVVLEEHGVEAGLRIGVGVDCGRVIITRIGLADGHETTAYGDAVNTAAKLSGADGEVLLSEGAYEAYPSSPGGLVRFEPDSIGGRPSYRPRFPISFLSD